MKILLSGCSITATPKSFHNGVWSPAYLTEKQAYALGECIDGDVEILSRDGAGNKYITRSLLRRLTELKGQDLKVIYQITIADRYDFYFNHIQDNIDKTGGYITEKIIPNFKGYTLPSDYETHDKYYTLRTTADVPNLVLSDVEKNYIKYMASYGEQIISQIENILLIQNYCEIHNIPVKFIEYQREGAWINSDFNDYLKFINFDNFVDEPIIDYIYRMEFDKQEWTRDGGHPLGWVHKKFYEDKLKEWVLS